MLIFFLILIVLINISLLYSKTMTNLLNLVLVIFLSCIFFFISLGTEFIMFAYLLIYIGAIIVMFLFVVMIIDVKTENSKDLLVDDLFLNFLLVFILVCFFYFVSSNNLYYSKNVLFNVFYEDKFYFHKPLRSFYLENNLLYFNDISIFGEHLFNTYFLVFLMAALVLLIAMIISVSICFLFFLKSEIK